MDIRKYYDRTRESQWEIFGLILSTGQVEKIVPMIREGYTVTGRLLEALRVFGHEKIIDEIVSGDFVSDISARDFLLCLYGKEKVNSIFDALTHNKHQQKKKEEQKQRANLDSYFDDLAEKGLSKELFDFANKNGYMQALCTKFGKDEVYEKACFLDCYQYLPKELLFEKGDFRVATKIPYEEKLIKEALKFTGGAEAVYAFKNGLQRTIFASEIKRMSEMLVRAGRKDLFYADSACGFKDLDAIGVMTLDDWKKWKSEDENAMWQYLREHKSFVFRTELAWKLR